MSMISYVAGGLFPNRSSNPNQETTVNKFPFGTLVTLSTYDKMKNPPPAADRKKGVVVGLCEADGMELIIVYWDTSEDSTLFQFITQEKSDNLHVLK